MKIKFCGAAQFVTGSSHLITLDNGYKILLDCGLFQGKGKNIWEWNNEWKFNPKEIDCLILSHAHIDHTGRVPMLIKHGFKGTIYSTHATRSLCNIMLMDSARIQSYDVRYYNERILRKKRSQKKLRVPLYEEEDVFETMLRFVTSGYEHWLTIDKDVSIMFRDSGHILGSASVTLKINENGKETIVGFTGDIGRPDRPILRDPKPMPEVDYLIAESTYGNRLHEAKPEQEDRVLEIINETCVRRKGKLIIPAFSVGRTQEIVYMLDKLEHSGKLPKIPVYVDSPLAVNATRIYSNHLECYDKEILNYMLENSDPFGFNELTYIREVKQSKAINDKKEPCIIISSAGMMNAGRVKHHLYNNVEDKNTTIFIVGYCSPGTPGALLQNGVKTIRLFGKEKEVNARIELMDSFSAHGDYSEMMEFLKNQVGSVKELFLVHGELDTQERYREKLMGMGFKNIRIPKSGQVYKV